MAWLSKQSRWLSAAPKVTPIPDLPQHPGYTAQTPFGLGDRDRVPMDNRPTDSEAPTETPRMYNVPAAETGQYFLNEGPLAKAFPQVGIDYQPQSNPSTTDEGS